MKKLIYSLIILQLLVFSSCGEKKTEDAGSAENQVLNNLITITQEQFNNSEMVLGSITEKPFPVTIKANGMIDVPPENRAVVSASMGGYIKNTPLIIGDKVTKGQRLVTIENPEFITLQQSYMEVKQELTYLNAEYERQQKLKEENITSQKSLLKAESEFKTANARYSGLKKQLTMLNISPAQVEQGNISSVVSIYSPISGSITQMNVTRGTYVSPASSILEIIDSEHMHLELSVFEKDIMVIKKGQKISFRIPEASSKTFAAEVHLIGTTIDDNRTIKVHGHLKDEETNFLTGMFVAAQITSSSTLAKSLPSEAVVEQSGSFFVLKLESQQNSDFEFKKVVITPGLSNDGFTAVEFSDVNDATGQFLTSGAFHIITEETDE